MRLLSVFIGLFLLAFALNGTANTDFTDPSGWKVSRTAQSPSDVATWKKSIAGEPLDAFKGEITVSHSIVEILAVFADVENFNQWVFNCDSASQLPELGSDYAYVYVNGIWPVNDRDIVLHNTLSQDPDTLAVTIRSLAKPHLLPDSDKAVRIPRVDNRFIFTPLGPKETRITFTTLADPGGKIPAWLANFVAVKAPYVTLSGLKKRLELPQYHLTKLDQLPSMLSGVDQLVLP